MKKRDLKREIRKVEDGIDVEKCLQEIEGKIELVDYNTKRKLFSLKKVFACSLLSFIISGSICIPATYFLLKGSAYNVENNQFSTIIEKSFKHYTSINKVFFKDTLLEVSYAQRDKKNYILFLLDRSPSQSIFVTIGKDTILLESSMTLYYSELQNSEKEIYLITYNNDAREYLCQTSNYIEYIYFRDNADKDSLITPVQVP